ncbi:unnamed protein product [Euphydryas editha]|uniref:Uncharacterized protein n=1 Tax=Euphydryas editha TaxID=104508 RepID=A0AAU9TDG1_EUPED|nr:unnamed protein product [Euphydryas editha]
MVEKVSISRDRGGLDNMRSLEHYLTDIMRADTSDHLKVRTFTQSIRIENLKNIYEISKVVLKLWCYQGK